MTVHTTHKTHDRFATRSLDPGLSLSIHKRPKYHLRAGLEYLHWSGGKLTSNRAHAWVGTIDQAKACRRTFNAAAGCRTAPVAAMSEVSTAHNKNLVEE